MRRLPSYLWQPGMLEPLLQLRDVVIGNGPRQQAEARAFTAWRNRQFFEKNRGAHHFIELERLCDFGSRAQRKHEVCVDW
jgi:hypothetical protein